MPPQGSLEEQSRNIIASAIERYPNLCTPCGLNLSGLVLIDLAYAVGYEAKVVFVDTGYHFPQTLRLWESLQSRYDRLEFVTIGSVHEDIEMYLSDPVTCCQMRKVDPLSTYLQVNHVDAILTGRTKTQGISRNILPIVEEGKRVKINAVVNWSRSDLERYAKVNNLTTNPLYTEGFLSIGCWPCTQPVVPGHDERSGRFIGQGRSECGLWTKGNL